LLQPIVISIDKFFIPAVNYSFPDYMSEMIRTKKGPKYFSLRMERILKISISKYIETV